VSDRAPRTIRIKWVRSGIGFSCRQKAVVRSLGLRCLNQVVERPDTPQIRGLVAKVSHLVTVVGESPVLAWASVPEYTIRAVGVAPPQESVAAAAASGTEPAVLVESTAPEAAGEAAPPTTEPEEVVETPAPPKAAEAEKPGGRAAPAKKPKAAKAVVKPTKKTGKAAPSKASKTSKAKKK
jgi:large subunit ribosomal protein L30